MFDYENLKLVEVIVPGDIGGYDVPVVDIVVTRDGRKLYYTSSVGGRLFTSIDLFQDRVVALQLTNSISYLGITPDNGFIYLTDPGGFAIPPLPTGKIGIYSPFLEKSGGSIDICQFTNLCNGMQDILSDQIAVSPDGRKAYVSMFWLNNILVIDTQKNVISKVIAPPPHMGAVGSFAIRPPKSSKF